MYDKFDNIFSFRNNALSIFVSISKLCNNVENFYEEPNQDNANKVTESIQSCDFVLLKLKSSLGSLVKDISLEEDEVFAKKNDDGYSL